MDKPETFNQFLQEEHSKNYIGSDDDMPDAFNDWLVELEGSEWEDLGEAYGQQIIKYYESRK